MGLRTSTSKTIFNYTLTENQFSLDPVAGLYNGTLKFTSNNKLCNSTDTIAQNYWNGYSCTDRKLVPQFSTNAGSLQSNLMSSKSNMTFEIWIKDSLNVSNI